MRRMTSIDRFSDAGASHTAKSQLQTRPLHLAKLKSDQLYSTVQGGSFCTSSLSSNTVWQKDFVIHQVGLKYLMMNIFAHMHSAKYFSFAGIFFLESILLIAKVSRPAFFLKKRIRIVVKLLVKRLSLPKVIARSAKNRHRVHCVWCLDDAVWIWCDSCSSDSWNRQ